MLNALKKIIGDDQQKKLKKYAKIVDQINALEPEMEKLSDEELKNKTAQFKEEIENGKTIFDIQIEAFAVVREASKRVLGMRHFDVQLIGGLVLTEGNIAEMATGEGKTLVASLPAYLRALEGKGVHIITVNDYLAKRDRNLIGKIHEFLGLTVGLNVPMLEPDQKKAAYAADITYGIGTEFGFDFLRDNMVQELNQRVQRPYHYAIVDEIDSVLIDEAKTPLIIAGKMEAAANLHNICARLAKRFKRDVDYTFDPETKATNLTDEGITQVERAFGVDNLYDLQHQTLYHYAIQALRAHVMFQRDVDYIVQDGKVMLVDMFTGRIMEGRTLSDGLHQAIEAKEGLEITEENKSQASITIQNYFRMYPILSGMTGTAKTEEKEFNITYGMEVIQIPTNKPVIRDDMQDRVYKTKDEKYVAMAQEIKERHSKGQPILVGTTSIIQSEKVAEYLDKERLPYEILNAKSVEQEVRLISLAGQKGQITIATNMAGRGTDIMLGEGVAEVGGLHVLGTEKHEARRIDNQLRGRSGRQGDPGSTQFFISIEDDLFRRFAHDELEKLTPKLQTDEDGLILNKNIYEFVERTQRICEGSNYAIREYNLKLDDIVNDQRKVIYNLRDQVLEKDDMLSIVLEMIPRYSHYLVDKYCTEDILPEEWELDRLASELNQLIAEPKVQMPAEVEEAEDVHRAVAEAVEQYLENLEEARDNSNIQQVLKRVLVMVIDKHWVNHLETMTRIKEGIGMRHYQQEDPLRLYQNEGLEVFHNTYALIDRDASLQLARLAAPLFKKIKELKQENHSEENSSTEAE
ncbi:accessory Sec system translocase SecA2 [Calidifontibacillus oryziterrae]|uniref:accessory Sec system translocase SecA2 n=1 Tax=Calidifontibacillus oryziterrae TaxID=1191699 RepID=UPI00031C8AD1|nr:accessory Sec system translocase SecA2 [Calidifontibacillus oryziterrae]